MGAFGEQSSYLEAEGKNFLSFIPDDVNILGKTASLYCYYITSSIRNSS